MLLARARAGLFEPERGRRLWESPPNERSGVWSFSDALAHAYVRGLRAAGAGVELLALRDLHFDPNLRHGFSGQQEFEPSLRQAQLAIEGASHIAWFFPTWWAGPPALVKAFIDRTFLPG